MGQAATTAAAARATATTAIQRGRDELPQKSASTGIALVVDPLSRHLERDVGARGVSCPRSTGGQGLHREKGADGSRRPGDGYPVLPGSTPDSESRMREPTTNSVRPRFERRRLPASRRADRRRPGCRDHGRRPRRRPHRRGRGRDPTRPGSTISSSSSRTSSSRSMRFLAFARRIGEPVEYPFVKGIEGYPEIISVTKLPHETVNFGGIWHSDTTYLERPPMATLLIAREVPPFGGDTMCAEHVRRVRGALAGNAAPARRRPRRSTPRRWPTSRRRGRTASATSGYDDGSASTWPCTRWCAPTPRPGARRST